MKFRVWYSDEQKDDGFTITGSGILRSGFNTYEEAYGYAQEMKEARGYKVEVQPMLNTKEVE